MSKSKMIRKTKNKVLVKEHNILHFTHNKNLNICKCCKEIDTRAVADSYIYINFVINGIGELSHACKDFSQKKCCTELDLRGLSNTNVHVKFGIEFVLLSQNKLNLFPQFP